MKKALSVLLAVVMILSVFSILPLSAGALARYTYGDWEYEVWSGYDSQTYESYEEICITNYTGSAESVTIPNTIDGKPVRYLYNNYIFGNVDTGDQSGRHFANHDKMTTLYIPENLKYIAGFMLMDCTKLSTVIISSGNKNFEYSSGVLYMKDGGKTWGDHVYYHASDEIADEYGVVFCRFNKLSVDIPTKVTTIHQYAFYNHEELTHINLPTGKLSKIEDYAFYNTGLTDVKIPYGVKSIGYSAFMYCKDMHEVQFPTTLETVGSQAFLETEVKNFYLPSKTTEIGNQAFGYSGKSNDIYVTGSSQAVADYNKNTGSRSHGSGGGSGSAMFLHDPDRPETHFYLASASVPPTCTTFGVEVKACFCGFLYYDLSTLIPPTGHNMKEKKTYSTCTEQGYTLHYCTNCNYSYKTDFKKLASHWKVNIPAVEPTATTAGRTAGQYCQDCGQVFVQSKIIPPTGYAGKSVNDIDIIAEPDVTPKVLIVTDEDKVASMTPSGDQIARMVYDIKLEKGETVVQPEGDVVLKIPCDDPDAQVYRQEEDGSLTKMDAYYEDGHMIFVTDHFSLYSVTSHVPEQYKLWVNNEQFTEDHLTVQCGDGTATYDPKENTLTLDNAQITRGAEIDGLGTGILTFLDDELTVIVNGDCSITETGGDGIGSYEFDDDYNMVPHDITVKGDGKLKITESEQLYGYGFYCTGDLRLEGVDIDITSAATGVWTNNMLTVQDSKLNVRCASGFSGFVVNHGSAVFDNSKVYAESASGAGILLGNDRDSSAMLVSSGEVILKGVIGVGADTENGAVSVSGGKLVIEAQNAAFNDTFLTNQDQHILLGEGVEVISGAVDSASVIIGVPTEPQKLGDADGNGEVDVIDATVIQRYTTLINVPYDKAQLMCADIDGDGDLTIVDATFIQRYSTMIKTPYDIGEYI